MNKNNIEPTRKQAAPKILLVGCCMTVMSLSAICGIGTYGQITTRAAENQQYVSDEATGTHAERMLAKTIGEDVEPSDNEWQFELGTASSRFE